MISRKPGRTWLALILALGISCRAAFGATAVDVIQTDLPALIRGASSTPAQFAVHVPHATTLSGAGEWSVQSDRALWRYSVRIPTAVSMSFHATRLQLPSSAALTVRTPAATIIYTRSDAHGTEFWSRIQPGDTLEFELDVAATDRADVALDIVSFQAGYRGLGRGVTDHPAFRKVHAMAAGTTAAPACVENYACKVNSNNEANGQATVAIVVGNMYQCTATLVDDVPQDNTPYLLTARHCQTGKLGGGNPGAASSVMVYWDAMTACGETLGSLYDPGTVTQSGATTVVEQEDAWLLKLNENPKVQDAQFAGIDASGGAVQGGYSVHHALGRNKQFTGWFGQAASVSESGVLGVSYLSHFLKTVNSEGASGPGASGGALFDQNGHLVGALSVGLVSASTSSYDACPSPSPSLPSATNFVDAFTSLAAVWDSTSDTTSTTGATTLKSVLDPGNTGTKVTASVPVINVRLTSSHVEPVIGNPMQLTWSAPANVQCAASGGTAGDGWGGALATSGTMSVTETTAATVTYGLTCTLPGGRTVSTSLPVTWQPPAPQLTFHGPFSTILWTTRPATLTWSSNVEPCSVKGGSLSTSNLPASGSLNTTQDTPGDVTYLMTCGPAGNSITQQTTISYVTPSLLFVANGTDRILGESLELRWQTFADSCVPSGGAPNDGWNVTAFRVLGTYPAANPRTTTTGRFTYTLTCTSGPLSVQQSIDVLVENDAPYVTASVDHPTVTFNAASSDYVSLSWRSNLTNCSVSEIPYIGNVVNIPAVTWPSSAWVLAEGVATFDPMNPGTYVLSVTCRTGTVLNGGAQATSTPITVTVAPPPPPTAQITSTHSVGINRILTVTWSTTDAKDCVATGDTGGITNVSWNPGIGAATRIPPSGSAVFSGSAPGTATIGLTCHSIDPNQTATVSAQTTVTVVAPTVTLTSSASTVTTGQPFTLTWSTVNADSCSASAPGVGGWSGSQTTSGSASETITAAGQYTFYLTCLPYGSQSQATVTVSAPTSGGSASSSAGGSGGGGGGGALGVVEIFLLASCLSARRLQCWRRVSQGGHLV